MALAFDTDEGFGTRATLGVIVLQTDESVEPEFRSFMPGDGIALYHSRVPMVPEITAETLATMREEIPHAVELLPSTDFTVIGYGCTSGSTVIGEAGVREAVQSIRPGVQVSNPLSSTKAALEALGVKRLGFVTPYIESVSRAMREALEAEGMEITAFGSFEEGDDRVVARITPASVEQAIYQTIEGHSVDAVFVSCTNLRVGSIISKVEENLGIPLLSSNQTMAWHMLRLAGISEPLPQFGKLGATGL